MTYERRSVAYTGANSCSSNACLMKGSIPAFLKPLMTFVGVFAFVKASLASDGKSQIVMHFPG